ncbi:hypothetical protein BDZ89DRAFT_1079789 [Hymenopellis radicata]|nr:hypothetical protein BDZ89DRAFT_1079789 [Hymenopellis radicata]
MDVGLGATTNLSSHANATVPRRSLPEPCRERIKHHFYRHFHDSPDAFMEPATIFTEKGRITIRVTSCTKPSLTWTVFIEVIRGMWDSYALAGVNCHAGQRYQYSFTFKNAALDSIDPQIPNDGLF